MNLCESQCNSKAESKVYSNSISRIFNIIILIVLEFQKQLEKLSKRACSNCIITIDPNKDLHTELKKQLLVAPPMVAGMAIYENASTAQYTIEILFNGVAIHSPPMALSFLTNAMLGVNTCNEH
jgi:hypothetical protein